MDIVVNQILPLFLLIGLGWVCARFGISRAEDGDVLSNFAFRVAIPALLFRTMLTAEGLNASSWRIWIVYFAPVSIVWAVGHLLATRAFGRSGQLGVISGMSAAYANTVFVALPLVSTALSHGALVALSVLLTVHLPIMTVLGAVLMDRENRREGTASGHPARIILVVASRLARNPLMLALLVGILGHLLGVPYGGMTASVINAIAGIAGPLALISLGMALRKYGLGDTLGLSLGISGLKLILLPALVWAVGWAMQLPADWIAALVLTAAVPTGVNTYLLANNAGVGQEIASSTILVTSLLGVFSVSAWALLVAVPG